MSDNVVELYPTLRDSIQRYRFPKAQHFPTQFERCCRAARSAELLQKDLKLLVEFTNDKKAKELLYSAINAVADAQISIAQVRKKS